MNSSQIFKLIFTHDLRVNNLSSAEIAKVHPRKLENSIMDFMAPDPTYSKLHFTGTNLETQEFGLNILAEQDKVISAINSTLIGKSILTKSGGQNNLQEAIENTEINDLILITPSNKKPKNEDDFVWESNLTLKKHLEENLIVIHKVSSPNGYDLIVYSKKNLYPAFFPNLKELIPHSFRFFSINGKKFNSERHFYFETWTLDRPPHGFEEVFPESVI